TRRRGYARGRAGLMRRRAVGRDLGLTLRMLLALALLAAFYAGIAAGVIAIFWWQPGWLAYGIAICAITLLAAVAHFRGSESLVLRSAGARSLATGSERHLQRRLERLAELADLPVPRLAIVDTETPNAFTVGIAPARAVVAATSGLSRVLDERELDAVLSDEHIPSGALRLQGAAEAFCIVPVRTRRFELFMDHPPLRKRLVALEELARAMGKPARA